jgi:sugar transferase (PEP-CTERM system associated)
VAILFMQRVTWRFWGLIASETAVIVAAVVVAAASGPHALSVFGTGAIKTFAVVASCQLCLYYAEAYDSHVAANRRELVVRLVQAIGAASVLLAILYAWFPQLDIGRSTFLAASTLALAALLAWRRIFEVACARLGRRERLLLVGRNAATAAFAREIAARPDLGVDIVGVVADGGSDAIPAATLDDVPAMVADKGADRVVISLADSRGRLPMAAMLAMKVNQGIRFDDLASVYEECTGKIALENLRPSWLIFSNGFKRTPAYERGKSAADRVIAIAGLVIAAPVMAVVAVAVKVTSHGPVFYHQNRVGRHGRIFAVHKFRSMRIDAEAATGPVWASANDARVTPVGRFLRRSRLDELPQLWNVVRGDMSLVGPRPERPEFVEELVRKIPLYAQRHVVKPGITGWAQVKYTYGSSVNDSLEKLQFDLFYVKNMSLALDAFIALKTIEIVLQRRGV